MFVCLKSYACGPCGHGVVQIKSERMVGGEGEGDKERKVER